MTASANTTATASGVPASLPRALSNRTRPPRPNGISASLTHFWRAMLGFKHGPAQLIDMILFPFVFLLVFTYLFGGAIEGSTTAYLQDFLPGVLVQSVVLMTVYTGTAVATDITKGIHDRFRTLPFWQPATIVGSVLGDLVRYILAMTMTVLMGVLLGFRPHAGIVGVLLTMVVLVVFAFSVSWVFTALGVVAKRPESVSGTSMLVLFPLVFASNIFVHAETMPGWMQAVVNVNPITHAATAARGFMHGTINGWQVGLLLVICAAICAVFAPLTMFLYTNKAKR